MMLNQKIVWMMIMLWAMVDVEAQGLQGLRLKASYQVNFLSGVVDVHSFTHEANASYLVSYIPSVGTGISVGWSFGRAYVDLGCNVSYGASFFDEIRFNQKLDNVVSLSMGITWWRGKSMSVDVVQGVGWGTSSFYFANRQLNDARSLTTHTLVVPVAVVWWIGDRGESTRHWGVMLEYMYPFATLGYASRTGLEGDYADVEVMPSTLSLGLKYQF